MGTLIEEQIIASHRLIDNRVIYLSSPISGVYKITEFIQRHDETQISSRRFTDLLIASNHYDAIVEGNIK